MTLVKFQVPLFSDTQALPSAAVNQMEAMIVSALDGVDGGDYSTALPLRVGGRGISDMAVANITIPYVAGPPANWVVAMADLHEVLVTDANLVPDGTIHITLNGDAVGSRRVIVLDGLNAGVTLRMSDNSSGQFFQQVWTRPYRYFRIELYRVSGSAWRIEGIGPSDHQAIDRYEAVPQLIDIATEPRVPGALETATTPPYFVAKSKEVIFHTSTFNATTVGAGYLFVVLTSEYVGKRVRVTFTAGVGGIFLVFKYAASVVVHSTTTVAALPTLDTFTWTSTYEPQPISLEFIQTGVNTWQHIDSGRPRAAKRRRDDAYAVVSTMNAITPGFEFFVLPSAEDAVTVLDQWVILAMAAFPVVHRMEIRIPPNYAHDEIVVHIVDFTRESPAAFRVGPVFRLVDGVSSTILAEQAVHASVVQEIDVSGNFIVGGHNPLTVRFIRTGATWLPAGMSISRRYP